MRMLPSEVTRATCSGAERRFFERLRDVETAGGPGAVSLHSLNLSEHERKIVAELDFVILSRRFILVLEVKGGGVSCDEDGIWTLTRRDGSEVRARESPFEQARSGMFSLRKRLEGRFGRHRLEGLPWGYGVVFPDVDFDVSCVEWDDAGSMILDAETFRSPGGVEEALEALAGYWSAKQGRRGALRELSRTELSELLDFMRPRFDRVQSLRVRADQLDAAQEELTREQYRRLDEMEENDRILCSGGAGAGKTFLAAEIARREAAAGRSVLLTVASPNLASFLAGRLEGSGAVIATATAAPDQEFEVLIVDEAQDLMNLDDLDGLDRRLAGGLHEGRWLFLYDANRQAGITGRFAEDALELLASTGAARLRLSRNCRNTEQIALQTKLVTGGDLGVATAGEGLPVEITGYADEAELISKLDQELRRLADQDVPPGDITILTCKELDESALWETRRARRGGIRPFDEQLAASWPNPETTAASVAGFKGMENRFILLIEPAEIAASLNVLYVGMSRARSALWLAAPNPLISEITFVSQEHLPLVLDDLEAARG